MDPTTPTEKKHQHYVPQHYLRQFRCGETNMIHAAHVEPFQYKGKVRIKKQCKADYFYGEDGHIEDSLSKEESETSRVLYRVAQNAHFKSGHEGDFTSLCRFATLLYSRTRKRAEAAKLFPLHIGNGIIKQAVESWELRSPKGGWKNEMLDYKGISGQLLTTSVGCCLEMATLHCKLLKSPPGSYFITSDNPVLTLNQFATEANSSRSYVGFAMSGFQLWVPISPTLYLYFYDPTVYKVGSQHNQLLTIDGDDVELLNGLQVQSSDVSVYFSSEPTELQVEKLCHKYAPIKSPITSTHQVFPGLKKNEEFSVIRPLQLNLPKPFNFSRTRKLVKVKPGDYRNQYWTELIWKEMDEAKRQVKLRKGIINP